MTTERNLDPVAITPCSPLVPTPVPGNHQLSVSTDSPFLDVSHKGKHTVHRLLCGASFKVPLRPHQDLDPFYGWAAFPQRETTLSLSTLRLMDVSGLFPPPDRCEE